MAETLKNVYIAGLGAYTPDRVVTNEDFEKIRDRLLG